MATASAAAGLASALQDTKQELGEERASLGVSPLKEPEAKARVSILGLQKIYPQLSDAFNKLASRDADFQDMMGDDEPVDKPTASAKEVTKINFIDFAAPLQPLPASVPLATDSAANKFLFLVWKLLDACESGGVGGDACRQADVLGAATDDAINEPKDPASGFQLLLGLTLAISNHGIGSFIERGDPDIGAQVLTPDISRHLPFVFLCFFLGVYL